VYTNEELDKLYEKTSMRFFHSTNKYGITPSQEQKILKKMQAKKPPTQVILSRKIGGKERKISERVITRYVQKIPTENEEEEDGLVPKIEDHNVEEMIEEEKNDTADQTLDQENEIQSPEELEEDKLD